MTTQQVKDRLCNLGYPERITECEALLRGDYGPLDVEARSSVWHFKAHAHRQLHQPSAALATCEQAWGENLTNRVRAIIVENQAMSLYDLGLIGDLPSVFRQFKGLPIEPAVLAHVLVLRGCVLSWRRDRRAFRVLERAAAMLRSLGYQASEAWAQRSAASLTAKLGMSAEAFRWADMITYEPALPQAAIIKARAACLEGRSADGLAMADEVLGGIHGEPAADDRAWVHWLRSCESWKVGDLVSASAHLQKAQQEIREMPRMEIDLVEAVDGMRQKLRRGEVA